MVKFEVKLDHYLSLEVIDKSVIPTDAKPPFWVSFRPMRGRLLVVIPTGAKRSGGICCSPGLATKPPIVMSRPEA
jgi:hypothetical protein